MAEAHVGIGSTPRRINQCYAGIGGGARLVREIYAGINGATRLAWTFGINRLYFASYLGVGECDIATFAIIKPANDIAYMIGSLGGIKRRLWVFDNYSSQYTDIDRARSRMMELDKESRAVIRSQIIDRTSTTSWTRLGGTANRLYKAQTPHLVGSPIEIDPETYGAIRSSPTVEYGTGGNGVASTGTRLLTFSSYGGSGQNIMHERDPATLGVIRSLASLQRCSSYTGIDEQIFSLEAINNTSYKKINHINTETLAIIRSGSSMGNCQSIGGTKS